VLLLTCILGLIVVGPIGSLLTQSIVAVVRYLNTTIPWLEPTLLGALAPLLIMAGVTFSLFPVALQSIASLGYETVYTPGMIATVFALAGMSVAVARKTKSGRYKAYSLSSSLTAVLGVAQPSLYGIALPLRRPLVAVMIAGGIGGLIGGLSGFRVYTLVPPGLVALAASVGDAGLSNVILGVVIMMVAFVAAFILTTLFGFDEPSSELVEEAVGQPTNANSTNGGDNAGPAFREDDAGKDTKGAEPSGTPHTSG
jgi:PTS system beta-glucosides-specific IIC component